MCNVAEAADRRRFSGPRGPCCPRVRRVYPSLRRLRRRRRGGLRRRCLHAGTIHARTHARTHTRTPTRTHARAGTYAHARMHMSPHPCPYSRGGKGGNTVASAAAVAPVAVHRHHCAMGNNAQPSRVLCVPPSNSAHSAHARTHAGNVCTPRRRRRRRRTYLGRMCIGGATTCADEHAVLTVTSAHTFKHTRTYVRMGTQRHQCTHSRAREHILSGHRASTRTPENPLH